MVEGMSIREAAREFGLHRDTMRKMLEYSVPPGYRRQTTPRRPKLEPYTGVIDEILEKDHSVPKKQRHTAKRFLERSGTSTGLAADTPRSRTTCGSTAARRGRCSCRSPTHLATPSATSARPWWSSAEWSGRPTTSSWTCPTATAASSRLTQLRPPRRSWTATCPPSPSWAGCPEHSLRQYQAGGCQDPGRRPS